MNAMKRCVVAILALLMAGSLSACVKNAVPAESTPPVSDSAPPMSAAPSAGMPVQSVLSPTGGGSVVLPTGPLPDAPYTKPSSPPRYYAGTMLGLTPSDKYGQIVPYIGGCIHSMMGWTDLYGLCDLSGKIVCDPVYSDVEIISDGTSSLYALTVYEPQADSAAGYADAGPDYNSVTTLCPRDGSWAATYDNVTVQIWTSWSGGSMRLASITAEKDGKWGVIGYDGGVILPFQYAEPVCFSEGLASVLSDDGKSMWYINSTGKKVLGPYEVPPQRDGLPNPIQDFVFHNGYTVFYQDGKYGVIDKTGQVVVPALYDGITSIKNGMAVFTVGTDDVQYGLVTFTGKVVVEPTANNYIYYNGENFVLIDSNSSVFIILPDGTAQPDVPDVEPAPTSTVDGVYSSEWDDSQHQYVQKFDGKTIAWPSFISKLPTGNYILYTNATDSWQMYDNSANPVSAVISGYPEYSYNYNVDVDNMIFSYHWGQGIMELTPFEVYDFSGNRLLPDTYTEVLPFGDYFMVRTADSGGLVDTKGNWILQVPLLNYLPD